MPYSTSTVFYISGSSSSSGSSTLYALTVDYSSSTVSDLVMYNYFSVGLLVVICALLAIDLLRRLFGKRHD